MNRYLILFFSVVIVLAVNSCNKTKKDHGKQTSENIIDEISYRISFPDTVKLNKLYNGKVFYKSQLDSITTSFKDSDKSRYTLLMQYQTKDINYDFAELSKRVKDTFGALNNREIPFYDVKFNSIGVNYIDGIIYDSVILDTIRGEKKPTDVLPMKRRYRRITKKVIVVTKD